jgi:glycosyltransferase involved in cell wall biosynthesis
MKILWSSNAPWAPSGYGQQTALFAPRLAALGHDVAISAVWGLEGAGLEWNGLRVYPSDGNWGNELLVAYAAHHAGNAGDCQVIALHDAFVLQPGKVSPLNLAVWTPVDHEPAPRKVVQVFRQSGARAVAMSQFGKKALEQEGVEAFYVPHGVNTDIFRPLGDKEAIRERMGVPKDAFVVGMVAANQGINPPRKAFPQAFQAFAELRKRHSDALLHLHTDIQGTNLGLNLVDLANACGIPPEAVGSSDQFLMRLGFVGPHDMAALYNSMDVLLNPSYGEGFGIPIVEAQACGTPVITNDWTAMTELTGGGWLVNGDRWWDPMHSSWFSCPTVGEISQALEAAYNGAEALRDRARQFALRYDADLVTEQFWVPALEWMGKPREVAPLVRRQSVARPQGKRQKAKVAAR